MALVDDDEGVLGEVLDQRGRRLARPPAREVARVVLDPVAVAELAEHLHIEKRPLLEPLGLEEPVLRPEEREPLPELLLHRRQRALKL